MSDISLPPSQPNPSGHFIDKLPVKAALCLCAILAPVPMLLALLNIWLSGQPEQTGLDPFSVFRMIIDGGGSQPLWLIPVAFIPSVVLLTVLFRKSGLKMLCALLTLVIATCAETFFFLMIIQ